MIKPTAGTDYQELKENVIAIGAAFYSKQDDSEQMLTLVHEVLHHYLNADNHRKIVETLLERKFRFAH